MKKCLIIINRAAGGSKKVSFDKVEKCLGDMYDYTRCTLPDDPDPNPRGYDAVAICGGDGTLGSVLGKIYDKAIDVWYFPVGTLNDKAKAERYEDSKTTCPSCGGGKTGKQVIVGRCDDLPHNLPHNLPHKQGRLWGPQESPLQTEMSMGTPMQSPQESPSQTEMYVGTPDENSRLFTYVLAAGAFTSIGYTAKVSVKKKLGVLAYLGQVLKEYKPHRIHAQIDCGSKCYEGDFNLIMFVKSPRCFGFKFNKAYDSESNSGHLVAIRSPKHDGLLGKIEMFFPFFRVFFIGMKSERDGKIIFKKIYSATFTHSENTDYCRDGEKQTLSSGSHQIKFIRSLCNFNVIEKF
ncbi:MAG: hypothetical protein K2G31_00200 [Clostridia bacterium]|nr:hypothetical protein [Clostridia bacterium]